MNILNNFISDAMLLREGSWCKTFDVNRSKNGDELSVNLISQEWGMFIYINYFLNICVLLTFACSFPPYHACIVWCVF